MLFLAGIFLEVLSTLAGTAGKQLIRLSELQERHKAFKASRITFGIGMATNTLAGPLLDIAAYSFAAQSLIAPFGGLDVVWNGAFAPYFLKEKMTPTRMISCTLIFLGTLSSALFGTHSDTEYTVSILEDLLFDARVLIYLSALAVFVAFNILLPMRCPKGHIFRGVALGVTAGTIAGNMFCVKAAVELAESSLVRSDQGEVWTHWLPYVVIAGAVFFALSNLIFLTRGLLEFEALFMVTIYEGTMIVSNCVSANVILLEAKGLETWRLVGYCICIVVVVIGMVTICIGEARRALLAEQDKNLQVIGVQDADPEAAMSLQCEEDDGNAPVANEGTMEDFVVDFDDENLERFDFQRDLVNVGEPAFTDDIIAVDMMPRADRERPQAAARALELLNGKAVEGPASEVNWKMRTMKQLADVSASGTNAARQHKPATTRGRPQTLPLPCAGKANDGVPSSPVTPRSQLSADNSVDIALSSGRKRISRTQFPGSHSSPSSRAPSAFDSEGNVLSYPDRKHPASEPPWCGNPEVSESACGAQSSPHSSSTSTASKLEQSRSSHGATILGNTCPNEEREKGHQL